MSGVSLIAGIPVGSTLQAAKTWQQKLYGIPVPTEVEQLRAKLAETEQRLAMANAVIQTFVEPVTKGERARQDEALRAVTRRAPAYSLLPSPVPIFGWMIK